MGAPNGIGFRSKRFQRNGNRRFPYCAAARCVIQSGMQTLVLRIPDDLARELEAEATKTCLTKSEVARRRLVAGGSQVNEAAFGFDLISDLIGTVKGGPADMSARKKEYLKKTSYGKSRHR